MRADLWFLCIALLNSKFYQCIRFRVDSCYSLAVMVQKKKSNLKLTKGNNPKNKIKAKLWFLSTSPLNNVFYQCVKFQVNSFYSLEVMVQTKIQNEI